jgi:hypothetical protein
VGLLDGLLRRPQTPPTLSVNGPASGRPSLQLSTREKQEEAWRHDVARNEWVALHVPAADGGSPAHQYTVGLTERGLPEVVVYGLRLKTGMLVLDDLAGRLLDGVEAPDGVDVPDLLPDVAGTQLWDVSWLQDPLDAASRLYGDRVRARQLVVPDGAGRPPWDDDYETPHLQPVLFVPPTGHGPRRAGPGAAPSTRPAPGRPLDRPGDSGSDG